MSNCFPHATPRALRRDRRHGFRLVGVLGLFLALLFFSPAERASAAPAYPLKVVAGSHYLVDQNNTPFFVQGDSPWYLTESLNAAAVDYYLSNRWVQGYNSIILDLAAQSRDDSQSFEGNIYGQLPFTKTIAGSYTDLTSWNVNYFTNVDAVIQRAGYYGINVFAYPLYDGYGGASWYTEMSGNSSNAVWSYGNFIGNRYKNFTNIVWLGGGDYSEPNAPSNCLWNIVAAGIRSADTNHLFSAQAGRPTPAIYYAAFVTLNSTYGSQFPYIESLANYQRTPVLASFAREPYYEHRNITGTPYTALDCRHFAYWAVFSGDMGHFYGDEYQWPFTSGWQTEMWDAGATTITNVIRLMNTRPWWNCVPDASHATVTSGYGTSGTIDYVVCTREASGKTALIYIPQDSLTPTVDMTRISGSSANGWWYNPRTGQATSIGTYATTGTRTFTPPDSTDWVLVLDDSSQGWGAPGVSSTSTAPAISTFSASPASINLGSTATLSWSVSGNPAPSLWIDQGLGAVTGSSITVSPTATTTYTLTASNSVGSVSASAMVTVVVPDTTAPSVPTNLVATVVSTSQINLSWSVSTDNVGVAGYQVFRNGVLAGTTSGTLLSDTGLSAATTYAYTVAAYDAAGNASTPSTTVSATTLTATNSPPALVQTAGTLFNGSSKVLTQAFPTANVAGNLIVAVTSWGNRSGNPTISDSSSNNYVLATTSYSSAGDQSLAVYYAANIRGGSNTISATFNGGRPWPRLIIAEYQGLDPVSPLAVTSTNQGSATTAADSVTTGYGTTSTGGDLILGVVENYNVSGTVLAGSGYTLRYGLLYSGAIETALEDRIQTTAGSVAATFTFTHADSYIAELLAFRPLSGSADTNAPSVPTTLTATAVSTSQINLTWAASTDNVGVTGYQVFRNGTKVATVTATNYSDTGLSASTTYSYAVAAVDAAGNVSAQSTGTTATTQALPIAPTIASFAVSPTNITAGSSATLSWSVSGSPTPVLTINNGIGTVTGTSLVVSPTATTTYTLSASNSAGTASAQATVTVSPAPDTNAPSVPASLTATAVSTSQINLTWAASTDNVGVTGYQVFRNGTKVATVTATNYSDTGLSASTTYSYAVAAADAAGNVSAQSTSVSATTKSVTAKPAMVQTAASMNDGTATTITQAFSSANTASNLIAVVTSWGTGTASPTVTDTAGNSYTLATTAYSSTGDQSLAIYYAKNIKSGANSVTVNFGGSHAWRRILVLEYSGLDPANPVDVSNLNRSSTTGGTDSGTSGTITTTANGDLILGAVENYSANGSVVAGTGFTLRNYLNYNGVVETAVEDQVQTAAGSVAATFTFTKTDSYIAEVVAFRAASSQ